MLVIQVGYPVDPDARQNLITDYNRVLKYTSTTSNSLRCTFISTTAAFLRKYHFMYAAGSCH